MENETIIENLSTLNIVYMELLQRLKRVESELNIHDEERLGIKIDIESGKKDFLKLHIKKRSC